VTIGRIIFDQIQKKIEKYFFYNDGSLNDYKKADEFGVFINT